MWWLMHCGLCYMLCFRAVKLAFSVFGANLQSRPPLIILHGLLGSQRNWRPLAGKISSLLERAASFCFMVVLFVRITFFFTWFAGVYFGCQEPWRQSPCEGDVVRVHGEGHSAAMERQRHWQVNPAGPQHGREDCNGDFPPSPRAGRAADHCGHCPYSIPKGIRDRWYGTVSKYS